ncbi:MAG TPA: ubiquinol-cytochrome C chaperone family protein [Caulobacteraceae bacterium]|jgi:cytochrome b pre-mRNA-processing protein 3
MFLQRFLKFGPARAVGERLYAAIVAQARSPAIYADMGAPDTPDGRFEVYTLHVLLALERLRGQSPAASAVAQALFDAYLGGLDHGLREMAVGDLSVGKTMRKLGEAFYGRGKALDAALAELPDRTALEALIARTIFGGDDAADPAPLTDYFLAAHAALAETPVEALTAGEIAWRAAA